MFDENYLTNIQTKAGLPNWILTTHLGSFITTILPYIFGLAGIILILNIIVSGYQLMTSAGEPKTVQAAQQKITTSIIGIVIIFASFFVVKLILQFLGIEFDLSIIR